MLRYVRVENRHYLLAPTQTEQENNIKKTLKRLHSVPRTVHASLVDRNEPQR